MTEEAQIELFDYFINHHFARHLTGVGKMRQSGFSVPGIEERSN
jgi:hypothetical protein